MIYSMLVCQKHSSRNSAAHSNIVANVILKGGEMFVANEGLVIAFSPVKLVDTRTAKNG